MANKYVTTDTNLVELLTELKNNMTKMSDLEVPKNLEKFTQRVQAIILEKEAIFKELTKSKFNETLHKKNRDLVEPYLKNIETLKKDIGLLERNLEVKINKLAERTAAERAAADRAAAERAAQEADRTANIEKRAERKLERAARKQKGIEKKQAAETKKVAATKIQRVFRGGQARTELKKEQAAREQAAVSTVSTRSSEAVTIKEADVKEVKMALEVLGLNTEDLTQGRINKAFRTRVKNLGGALAVNPSEDQKLKFMTLNGAKELLSEFVNGNLTVKPQGLLTDSAAAASTPEMPLTSIGTKASVSRERAPSASVSSTPERPITSKEERINRQLVELHRQHNPQMNAAPQKATKASVSDISQQSALDLKQKYLRECNKYKTSTFYSNLKFNLQNTEFTAPTGKPTEDSATSAIHKAMYCALEKKSYNSTVKEDKQKILKDIAENFLSAPTQESRQQLLELFILTAGTHRNPTVFGLFNRPGSETTTIATFKEQIKNLAQDNPELNDSYLKSFAEEKLGLSTKGPSHKR